jgi:molecular chaperone DnaJ
VKGTNLRIQITLTLDEIAEGVEKKVKVKRKVQAEGVTYKSCSSCNGTGQVTKITNTILGRMQTAAPCTACGGAGQILDQKPAGADAQGLVSKEETVSIQIPGGVEDGMQLKVSGKGNAAPGDGIAGDLIVSIKETQHPSLKREGDNLHYDLRISFAEAVLGASKEIDAVGGKVRIKVDKGTQSGKVLRLRGKGVKSLNGYGKGDLLVHVLVWTPQKLSAEQEAFFEETLNDKNFMPDPKADDKSTFDRIRDMFS